ncbi:hypothetical protein Mapa_013475 [Marchantia paleacea]|nr:hypothetical protein Mapa_013475 [Marchantia paleacea]
MATQLKHAINSHSSRMKAILLIVAITASIVPTDAWLGINFGEDGTNIPDRARVVQEFRNLGITHVRLYHTYGDTLRAFASSGIELTVGITNADFQFELGSATAARRWVDLNVVPHGSTNIVAVTVGNEVLVSTEDSVKDALLPAMKNLREALNQAGKSGIKVNTAHAFDLSQTYPPSAGAFKDTGRMKPIVDWLASQGSTFICNIYPFFSYPSGGQVSLQQARLEETIVSVDGKQYRNILQQSIDAVYAALGKLGQGNMVVTVGETGWPTAGGVETNTENARIHNQNLVSITRGGTPVKPNVQIDAYIFAMFNENQKPAGIEQNWGLYNPSNLQKKYNIDFGNTPASNNRLD